MENINITYKEKIYEITPLCTVSEFIKENNIPVEDPVGVVINGYLTRLGNKLRIDSMIDIVELASPQGKKIYDSSVQFLFLVAFTKLFPDLSVFIQHSIHKGIYAEVHRGMLTNDDVAKLETNMRKMVSEDLPIERITKDWDIALSEMKEQERQDMVNLYRYYTPSSFKLYELDGVSEALYLPLVPSTKDLSYFKLEKYQDGVVIVIPDFTFSKEIPEFVDRPKLFKTYQEYHYWSRILKVRTVGQLNRYIMHGGIGDLIKVAEAFHEKRVAEIADQITERERRAKLVLIAGPTSSGKTTFAKRLGVQLMVNGYRPVSISMDNYFVDRDKTPRDEEGNYDFETIDAIDVSLFVQHISSLLKGEEIEIPRFDFQTGTKRSSGKKMRLESDEIVIIEGIHGINPKLTESISNRDKFKIYIAPLTQLNLHRHDRIPSSDTRLIRRLVRDSFFRGYSAAETLHRWRSVRNGEKKNIFPLQEEADTIYNSALFYELSVLKLYAERELLHVERSDQMYVEAQRLLKFLSYFLPLDASDIPSNSILKEFIGGSSFNY
ncbi:MAG: nucleoside kinase [Bacteriovoracaceae bacterium]|nr:nucleoside kinase [Bacteriovoracaceae bacterium]